MSKAFMLVFSLIIRNERKRRSVSRTGEEKIEG